MKSKNKKNAKKELIKDLTKEQWDAIPKYIDNCIKKLYEPLDKHEAKKALEFIFSNIECEYEHIVYCDDTYDVVFYSNMERIFGLQNKGIGSSKKYDDVHMSLPEEYIQVYHDLDLKNYEIPRNDVQIDSCYPRNIDIKNITGVNNIFNKIKPTTALHKYLNDIKGGTLDYRDLSKQITKYKHIQKSSFLKNWYSYYSFVGKFFVDNDIIEFENKELYKYIDSLMAMPGFIVLIDKVLYCSENAVNISYQNDQLHCDDGPAIRYKTGRGVYSLHGVRVPKELVMTPAEELSVEFFKNEKNDEVKAQFIRKAGIDKLESYGKVIEVGEYAFKRNKDGIIQKIKCDPTKDKRYTYVLLDMSAIYTAVDYAPHLKMYNPSTGEHHLEEVSPDCKTVQQAFDFRAQTKNWNPVTGS